MKSRTGFSDFLWIAGGIVLLLVIALLVLHSRREGDIATEAAFKARRVELVGRMRAALAMSSEAEKNAVMATTDQESQTFADQARAASAVVEQRRDEMGKLLGTGGTREERELLSDFSRSFAECQRIDHELLDLAVRNTNLKAYSLDFGPVADALASMDGALSRILRGSATSVAPESKQIMLLAADAASGARRIQALLPPHIFEESDSKMDELEAKMAAEDQEIRAGLKDLAALLGPGNRDLEAATSGYARFTDLRMQILDLSRQNTNVRSLTISLNQKRKAVEICQNALDALEKSIQDEGATDRLPENPR